ncbi:SRPBCC family protein [Amycolatopsis halotolerans]|uniref:SRPBCC family protein n=1 Tax=Amycolatopsis halotolerans TaxID=330083 RepID=A0ABV7QRQ7_9PSEU
MTEPLATIDFLTHSKVHIAAGAAAIWPHIVDSDGWRRGQLLTPLGGPTGSVGQRFHAASPEAPDVALYYVENAELVPAQRRTIRLDTLDGTFMGFATWELTPAGDGTMVAYDVYSRGPMLPPGQSAEDLLAWAQQMMDEGLVRLKGFIEGKDLGSEVA